MWRLKLLFINLLSFPAMPTREIQLFFCAGAGRRKEINMCNIAGYTGSRRAAPILLEMIKKQEYIDGSLSTGIATIHEGKLYTAKVLGNADTLIEKTDALNFPGTTGIIHSRPGNDMLEHAHPFVCGKSALVLNGTTRGLKDTPLEKQWNDAINMLYENGYEFKSAYKSENALLQIKGLGIGLHDTEPILLLEDYYAKQGMSHSEALARSLSTFNGDTVSVLINADTSDKIFVTRLTRPMNVALNGDESFIASTELAFPEDIDFEYTASLPTCRACEITPGGFEVTKHRVESMSVERITPAIFAEAYERMTDILKNGWEHFDTLEFIAYREWADLWKKKSEFTQYAELVYEVLYALKSQGRLAAELRKSETGRLRTFFHLV